MRKGRASLFDEDTSSVTEFHNPFLVASEQMKSMLFFDLSDLLAERRLADAQSLRSAREVKFLGQDNDCVQVTYINVGEHCSKPFRQTAEIGKCPTSSKGTSAREKAAQKIAWDERRKEICDVRKYFDAFAPQTVPELV